MPFAVFDIETRIDKRLLNQVFFAGDNLGDQQAYEKFGEQLTKGSGRGFFPTSLHVPISIAVGNVTDDYVLRSVESLAAADYSEPNLVRDFWARTERFPGCLVSFNGRRFDLPVLELQALRYGISAPTYFAEPGSARSRYSGTRHLDLMDFITNYGAFQIRGGMDLLLKMIGMPGKIGMDGSQVQEAFEAGRIAEIHRYCRSDVIQTYFLFIRVELMRGRIDETRYRAAHAESAHFLAELESREPPTSGAN
ncbi:MAG: 3'-5' exonuclease [Candidatus Binatales bacterium]